MSRKYMLILLFVLFPLNVHALTCNPGLALAKAEWASFGKIKTVIVVQPFTNASSDTSNSWLANGLSELLGDYLSAGKDVGVAKGLIHRILPPPSPNLVVNGSYQTGPNELRIHISVQRPTGEMISQISFSLSPPNTGLLFTEMAKAALQIFEQADISFDKKTFALETGATANFTAYSSYINGLNALWTFDPNYIDVAAIWFQEARKEDLYFQKPYRALENMFGYLAIMAKISGRPYTQLFEKLGGIENERLRYQNRPSPLPFEKPKIIKDKRPAIEDRFLNGNSHYLAGTEAIRNGNLKKARDELEASVSFVPEDSTALGELYNVYTQLGDSKRAEDVLNRTSTNGMCY